MIEMFNDDDRLSREYMSEVLDPPSYGGMSHNDLSHLSKEVYNMVSDEDFRDEDMELDDLLQENTIKIIQGRFNRKHVLSQLTRSSPEEIWHWLAVERIRILGEHPPEGSAITGPARAALFDNEAQDREPLSELECMAIDELLTTIGMRLIRSHTGFERKEINTNIARTEG